MDQTTRVERSKVMHRMTAPSKFETLWQCTWPAFLGGAAVSNYIDDDRYLQLPIFCLVIGLTIACCKLLFAPAKNGLPSPQVLRGRRAGDEGADPRTDSAPHPQPLSPEYRGEGSTNGFAYALSA